MARELLALFVVFVAFLLVGCPTSVPVSSVLSVSIDQEAQEVAVGATVALSVTVEVAGGASKAVVWLSENEGVARVSSEGVVTGVAVGEALIVAISATDADKADSVVVGVVPSQGVVLVGDSDDLARDAIVRVDVGVVLAEEDLVADESLLEPSLVGLEGVEPPLVARSLMEIAFKDDATVGDVNAVLESVGARIVSSIEGVPVVVVGFADPGDLSGLQAVMSSILAHAAVDFVLPQIMIEPMLVPDNVDVTNAWKSAMPLSHHLAVRAHGAWNLREDVLAAGSPPILVIADLFGNGVPGTGFELDVPELGDFLTGSPNDHGYGVLSIAAAAWDPVPSWSNFRDIALGMYPALLTVRAVDVRGWEPFGMIENRLIARVAEAVDAYPSALIVVNTSLGFGTVVQAGLAEASARSWITKVRGGGSNKYVVGAGLEGAFVHIAGAGNTGGIVGCADCPASRAMSWNAAALLDLDDGPISWPNLTNVLVVEGASTDYSAPDPLGDIRPMPLCTSSGSLVGGHVSAIGENVWMLRASGSYFIASGTSFAAPQVAGLALMLGALAPEMNAQQIRAAILATARPWGSAVANADCRAANAAPVIDALDAVLRAGGVASRVALLDVTNDGHFDEDDLAVFVAEWIARDGALDFSRYDLNGSGRSGGEARERFDLTMNGGYQNVQITFDAVVGGQLKPVTLGMHEQSVTDLDIMCFYAFHATAGLYGGDALARRDLIGTACATGVLDGGPGDVGEVRLLVGMGTYNYTSSGVLGTAFRGYWVFDRPVPHGGVTLSVRGPTGWNGDRPLVREGVLADYAGQTGAFYNYFYTTSAPAVAGSFVVSVEVGGSKFTVEASLTDATDSLGRPQGITTEVTTGVGGPGHGERLTVSWTSVPGAGQYRVRLCEMDGDECAELRRAYVTATSVTFTDLELIPSTPYRVYITAFEHRIHAGDSMPAQTNVSGSSRSFTIAAPAAGSTSGQSDDGFGGVSDGAIDQAGEGLNGP